MPFPKSGLWDVVDWSSGSIVDPEYGLIAQIGSAADSARPGMLSNGNDGSSRWVQLISNDGLPSDFVLSVSVPRKFTFEFDAKVVPPAGVVGDPSNVLAIGAQDRTGNSGLLFFGAGSNVAWLQPPPSGTTVPLGGAEATSAAAAIAAGERVTFRLVVNGDLGVMNFYATPKSVLDAGGPHILRATTLAPYSSSGGIPSSNLVDYFSLYARGTASNPSSIQLFSVRLSSQLIEPARRPTASILYDSVGGLGERMVLDGSQSADAGKKQLTYSWRIISQPTGASISLTGMQHAMAAQWPLTFTAVASGHSGNGGLIRIVTGDEFSVVMDTVQVNPQRIVITVVSAFGIVSTRAKDVIAAFTDSSSAYYNGAAAKMVLPELAVGASENDVVAATVSDLVLAGGSDATEATITFVPDVRGDYEFGLTVNNGTLDSLEETAVVWVGDASLVTGFTPDASYLWTYLSDFWNVVRGREPIETFWEAFIQKSADLLMDVAQTMDERSVSSFPENRVERWRAFTVREVLPQSRISRDGELWGSGFATDVEYSTSLPDGSQVLYDAAAAFLPIESILQNGWVLEVAVIYSLADGSRETRYALAKSVVSGQRLEISAVGTSPDGTVSVAYEIRYGNSLVGTGGLPYPYDDTAAEALAGSPVDFLTDKFWANGSRISVGDRVAFLGSLYQVTKVVTSTPPGGGTDYLCTVDQATIPVYEILNPGNHSARGAEDLQEERSVGDPIDTTTATIWTDYETFTPPSDGTGLRLWLFGTGVIGKARELSSWSENEIRLLNESDEVPCIRAHDFSQSLKIVSRMPGVTGDGWWVEVVSGAARSAELFQNSKGIRLTYLPGDTANSLIDMLTITAHPAYNEGVSRVVDVFPRSATPLSDHVYTLADSAVSEGLDWKLLRAYSMYLHKGTRLSFVDSLGMPVAHGMNIFEGDFVEFVDFGNVVAVGVVIGVGVTELMIGGIGDSAAGEPVVLSATASARSVVHRSRLATQDGTLSVPFLQEPIEIDERLIGTTSDPRLKEGVNYTVQPGWITSLAPDLAALRYGPPEDYLDAMDFIVASSQIPDRLWAEIVVKSNDETLGSNFGVLVGLPREAFTQSGLSVSYLSAVKGVMFALFRGPARTNIRIGGQIFCNLPFVEERGEIYEINLDYDLDHQLSRVQVLSPPTEEGTNPEDQELYTYTFPRHLGLESHLTLKRSLAVGDVVDQFQPICKGVQVDDYLVNPGWFRGHCLEVQKYHTFRVLIDSTLTSSTTIDLLSMFVKTIKPTWQKVVVGTAKTISDERDLTDSIRQRVRVSLRDDRFTCADEDVHGGFVQTFDDYDGGGSTWNADPAAPHHVEPRTKIDLAQHFDQQVGPDITLPSAVIGPPVVRAALPAQKGYWDHECSADDRQKNYFDRRTHFGPESTVDIRVCTYMPLGPMYPYVLYPFQTSYGTGQFGGLGEFYSISVLGKDFTAEPLVEAGLEVMLINTMTLAVEYDTIDEVMPLGSVSALKLAHEHASLDWYEIIVYRKTFEDHAATVANTGPGAYELTDGTVLFGFSGVDTCRVRVGTRVLVDPSGSNVVCTVTSYGSNTLAVSSVDPLPVGVGIEYRVLADIIGPTAVTAEMLDYWESGGACPSTDSIFRFDVLKPVQTIPIPGMHLLGPTAAKNWFRDGSPNYDSGYYVWFDWKLMDWQRDADGAPLPGSPPPYVDRVPPGVGTNDEATPWQPNINGYVLANIVACTVSGCGNGIDASDWILKNPAPDLLWFEEIVPPGM